MIAALVAGLAALSVQPPAEAEPDYEAIVVTGSRPNREPLPEPIEHYRRHCFEANRLTRRSAPPGPSDRYWRAADQALRDQLGVVDPGTLVYALTDFVRGHRLILRIERRQVKGQLVESTCRLIVIGGSSHDRLEAGMAALFRGPGTDRHVGHPAGTQRLAGWTERVWTGMPERGSKAWRQYFSTGVRGRRDSWLVVISDSFYDRNDYILGDLKVSEGRQPRVSILSFAYTSRSPG
jgi:hypothetical protein